MKPLIVFQVAMAVLAGMASDAGNAAPPRLPGFLTMPAGMAASSDVTEASYGEADFPRGDHSPNVQRGHHWQTTLSLAGVPDDAPGKDLWLRLKAALIKGGWTVVTEFDENLSLLKTRPR
jgi:hypothetical protein